MHGLIIAAPSPEPKPIYQAQPTNYMALRPYSDWKKLHIL